MVATEGETGGESDKEGESFHVMSYGKKRNERSNVGGVRVSVAMGTVRVPSRK